MNRDQFVAEMKAKIDKWNAAIHEMEAEMHQKAGEASAEYERQLAEMKRLRDKGQQQLHELRSESDAQFEKAAARMGKAWADIAEGFSRARSRLG